MTNVSQCTTFGSAFNGAKAFNQPLASWDVVWVVIFSNVLCYAYNNKEK